MSPLSFSIERMCYCGQTIPCYPDGGLSVQCCGSLMGQQETTICESFPAAGHLKQRLGRRQE